MRADSTHSVLIFGQGSGGRHLVAASCGVLKISRPERKVKGEALSVVQVATFCVPPILKTAASILAPGQGTIVLCLKGSLS